MILTDFPICKTKAYGYEVADRKPGLILNGNEEEFITKYYLLIHLFQLKGLLEHRVDHREWLV